MDKESFIAKYLDETVGLLLGAFGQHERGTHLYNDESWARDGKFMMQQMKRAKRLLERIWDDLHPSKGTK